MDIYELLTKLASIEDTEQQIFFYKILSILFPELKDMIYLSFNEPESQFERFNEKNFGNYNICGLGDYSKLWVIDNKNEDTMFKVSQVAYLDLNILDRLSSYIEGKQVQDEDDFLEFMCYLKKMGTNIKTSMIERMTTLYTKKEKYKENLLNYFKYLNADKLDRNTINVKVTPQQEDYVNKILRINKDDEKYAEIMKEYDLIYCMIAAAFYFKTKYKDKEKRINNFVEYCLNTLNVFLAPEMYTLLLFLKEKDNTGVFNKLQESKIKNQYSTFHNVAWDLMHPRIIEEYYPLISRSEDIISLPYFATNDKGLGNYLRLNPRRGIFIMPDGIKRSIFTHSSEDDILDMIPSEKLKIELKYEADIRKDRLNKVDFEKEKNNIDMKVKKLPGIDA